MKMTDLGNKAEGTAIPEKGENKIYYPSLYISKYPQELNDKDIGSVCRLEIEVKITGRNARESENEKKEDITLDVLRVGYISDGGKKTRDEYIKMSEKDRADYDKSQLDSEDDE